MITVKLSQNGFLKAAKELEKHAEKSFKKDDEFLRVLADRGAEIAKSAYADADENQTPPIVDTIKTKNGYSIVAQGQDVCFMEFGTGVQAGMGYDLPVPAPFAIAPGSWSIRHSRRFIVQGFWYFHKKRYFGTYPLKGMYYASKMMREKAKEIAREVYRSD